MKKLSVKTKKTVISVTAGVAAAAILGGVVFGLRGRGEPVGVYPFSMVGMTEFWGDNQESYGPVTTDRIQTVFLSDTQTITEVKVKEGDEVKKGDVLMTYDTTLSELQLERKRLDVEKANLQVKEAQEELARINQLEPMGNTDPKIPTVTPDYGDTITKIYGTDNAVVSGDASSAFAGCVGAAVSSGTAMKDGSCSGAALRPMSRVSAIFSPKQRTALSNS